MTGIIKKIAQINFGLLSPENIRKMSVTKIVTPDTYDEDGYPIEAGLMDPRLGVIDPGLRCRSCGSKGGDCQGHFGHINLARPVIHVGFADTIHKILRSTCSSCGKVLLTDSEKEFYMGKLDARIQNEESITDIIKEIYTLARRDDCPHCHQQAEIRKNAEFMIQSSEEILEEMGEGMDADSKKNIEDLIQKLVELEEKRVSAGKIDDVEPNGEITSIKDVTEELIKAVKDIKGKNEEVTKELQEFVEPIYQEAKRAQQRTIQEDIKIDKPVSLVEGNYKLTPSEVREWLEKIPEEEYYLVGINPQIAKPEWMVLTVLPVPPVTVRPSITLETGERSEDDLTHKLVDILRINQRLKENMEAGAPQLIVEDLWELLQYHVTTYFDNEASGVPPARHRSGRPLKTLAQRLKGKEGRFRSNLSGKRVNFSARTVISPDPNISINEVGVPEMIATEVTVPVYVTDWNIEQMKKHIENGSKNHPGANYVIRPDERKIRVYDETKESILEKLEPGYVVERHLMDGDVVLFNRQPSLHRMSMMAHEVKVLPHKTFRLNLCVCPPYNADFDGDEMNMHVFQTEESRAEAKSLMRVQEHILSPRFGGPIIGGIHDHISGGYLLTRDGSVFKEDDVFQMVRKSQLPLPEPKNRDWTGKEIFSLLLPDDLHMVYKAEICRKCDECLREECKNDAYVVIENGELIMGAIDEKAFGAFSGKILDSVVKQYGTDRAREFLDSATKLAISGIMKRGFTTSTADEEIPREAKDRIEELLSNAEKKVEQLIEAYHNEELEALPGRSLRETLEMKIMQVLGEARDKSGEIAESYFGMDNHAVIMALTGARGSMLNLTQIAACVGQQSVRGGRIERGYRNRTLPHFQEGELGAKASGFVHSSYKSGLDPLEFFFHAMGGREGLVDTAIRTAQSGYMQRRLVNALQDLNVNEDGTVRDNRGVVIQTRYGEDGIDPAKSDFGKVADIDRLIEEMRIKAKADK
ncbi:DNA-directed RNA polymerase subunit A' [Methanobacterium sp. CWC-01]|uniref:DNA-directed RNA polymerase subunit A' n=1 Tax=Methanobacterium aridiramus TaxID=2584467 RepID=UPI0025766722|nr:DNA-directed RNA polymerase subunit A' [Methanobacterium sp. CWC-01]WJI09312.1 DNA-directed RNA polymerase subunit A' [Methanobacterium sp. CWC-01]